MATKSSPVLGVHLLETVTRGMYSDPFHSIREYIQNAYDSIRKARRCGLLGRDEGCIKVEVDESTRRLCIYDNGTGLSPEEGAVHLLDIGYSEKARTDTGSIQNAGFRGIGRMAGISYCEKIRFETSNGDGRKCRIEFNAAGINKLTKPGQIPTTIIEAINQNSHIAEVPEESGKHFLQVVLEGLESGSPFLSETKLRDYLALNAPVPYDPSVWSYGDAIHRVAAYVGKERSLEHIELLICDSESNVLYDVRRPFRDTFRTANAQGRNHRTIKVDGIQPLPCAAIKNEKYWGWLAIHEREGALADVSYAGLRIRMHNIAIGDDTIVAALFSSPWLSRWCFGEIHITDLSLIPNSQRDDFEPSKEWDRIKEQLRGEARSLEQTIRRESSERNRSVSVLAKRTKNEIESAKDTIETGFISHEEKDATLEQLERTSKKLESEAKRRKRPEIDKTTLIDLQREVEIVKEKIKAVRKTGTDDALAHLNKQSRNVVRTVFRVLKNEVSQQQFGSIQEKIYTALKPGKRLKA